jgi:DNA-directed RNA polymerase subunit K/omega
VAGTVTTAMSLATVVQHGNVQLDPPVVITRYEKTNIIATRATELFKTLQPHSQLNLGRFQENGLKHTPYSIAKAEYNAGLIDYVLERRCGDTKIVSSHSVPDSVKHSQRASHVLDNPEHKLRPCPLFTNNDGIGPWLAASAE